MTDASLSQPSPFWQRKGAAFCSRLPGQPQPASDPVIQQAARVALALGRSSSAGSTPSWEEAQVVHPLTGEPQTLGFSVTDWASARDATQRRIEAIKQVEADPQRQFLALWRLLPEPPALASVPDAVRRFWRVLPVAPDAPSCLLWEHQALTAALAGTADASGTLRPALLHFNVADTQPFVTRARRTQDLWAGSYLLSFLCWQLLKYFADCYGPDCILQPLLRGQPLADLWLRQEIGLRAEMDRAGIPAPPPERLMISNIPNIFSVILPEGDVEAAVAHAQKAALDTWQAVSGSVREAVREAARRSKANGTQLEWTGCEDIWTRQEAGFLRENFFWAALPLPAGPLDGTGLADWRARCGPFLRAPDAAYTQIEAVLAAHPQEATGGLLYGLCSQLTAQLLSDRKRVRDFTQVNEPGVKCSLSGAMQAVYPPPPPGADELRHARQWWETLARFDPQDDPGGKTSRGARLKMVGRVRRGDRLGAIPLTKRLMLQTYSAQPETGRPRFDRHQFPSTAGIANAVLLRDIVRQAQKSGQVRDAIQAYITAARDGLLTRAYHYPASLLPAWHAAAEGDPLLLNFLRIDGDCLLDEFYDADSLRREFGDGIASGTDFPARLEAARAARRALLQTVGRQASRYYAIVAMDGDSMGEWISGQKTSDLLLGPDLHLAFTQALSGFALDDARRIVEDAHPGKLVYAGGDDVLALLPVSVLLPVLNALYRAFRGTERPDEPGKFSGFAQQPDGTVALRMGAATLSAGAVIVHEATPLSFAMEQARAAEQDAKQRHGRDAFAVRLLKRGGAPVEVGAKWRVEDPERRQAGDLSRARIDVPQAVTDVAALMRSGRLSAGAASMMADSPLEAAAAWTPDALAAARRAEFRRRIGRSLSGSRAERADAERRLEPLVRLVGLADPAGRPPEQWTTGWQDGWTGVQGLLRLAREMANLETANLEVENMAQEDAGAEGAAFGPDRKE